MIREFIQRLLEAPSTKGPRQILNAVDDGTGLRATTDLGEIAQVRLGPIRRWRFPNTKENVFASYKQDVMFTDSVRVFLHSRQREKEVPMPKTFTLRVYPHFGPMTTEVVEAGMSYKIAKIRVASDPEVARVELVDFDADPEGFVRITFTATTEESPRHGVGIVDIDGMYYLSFWRPFVCYFAALMKTGKPARVVGLDVAAAHFEYVAEDALIRESDTQFYDATLTAKIMRVCNHQGIQYTDENGAVCFHSRETAVEMLGIAKRWLAEARVRYAEYPRHKHPMESAHAVS